MKVGITGTRDGMTPAQHTTLGGYLVFRTDITEFHHGSCQGADVEAAQAVARALPDCRIICHPGPEDCPHQQPSGVDHERRKGKTHFARNRDIVNETDLLIVCPKQMEHQTRGGTWYTHDYARKKGKHVVVIWPSGAVEECRTMDSPGLQVSVEK
jgi:hypothetical protein